MATGAGLLHRIADALDNIYANGVPFEGSGMIAYDPGAITLVNQAAQDSALVVGKCYQVLAKDKRFRYTQFKDAVAYAAGQPCFHDASLGGVVTNDVSEAASASKPQVMGVCLGVQTQDYFGWIQTKGSGTALHNNDDDAAIGDEVIATVADTGVCNVGTFTAQLHVGTGEVAVVAGSNLQQVYISVVGG